MGWPRARDACHTCWTGDVYDLTGLTPIVPDREVVVWLLSVNAGLVLAMAGMIAWQVWRPHSGATIRASQERGFTSGSFRSSASVLPCLP